MDFYLKNKTLKVSDDETIMEIFSYFVNRDLDMIILAFLCNRQNNKKKM